MDDSILYNKNILKTGELSNEELIYTDGQFQKEQVLKKKRKLLNELLLEQHTNKEKINEEKKKKEIINKNKDDEETKITKRKNMTIKMVFKSVIEKSKKGIINKIINEKKYPEFVLKNSLASICILTYISTAAFIINLDENLSIIGISISFLVTILSIIGYFSQNRKYSIHILKKYLLFNNSSQCLRFLGFFISNILGRIFIIPSILIFFITYFDYRNKNKTFTATLKFVLLLIFDAFILYIILRVIYNILYGTINGVYSRFHFDNSLFHYKDYFEEKVVSKKSIFMKFIKKIIEIFQKIIEFFNVLRFIRIDVTKYVLESEKTSKTSINKEDNDQKDIEKNENDENKDQKTDEENDIKKNKDDKNNEEINNNYESKNDINNQNNTKTILKKKTDDQSITEKNKEDKNDNIKNILDNNNEESKKIKFIDNDDDDDNNSKNSSKLVLDKDDLTFKYLHLSLTKAFGSFCAEAIKILFYTPVFIIKIVIIACILFIGLTIDYLVFIIRFIGINIILLFQKCFNNCCLSFKKDDLYNYSWAFFKISSHLVMSKIFIPLYI
eukprot:jgi/Orpsp1_1/1183020/evm.model.c7180000083528.1